MSAQERAYLNRRRSQRASLLLPASVVTMSDYQYFELIDLSATGARLRGSTVPPLGKTGLLRLDGFQTLCKVVWTRNGTCGVNFEETIPPRVLAHFRDTGQVPKVKIYSSDED